MTLLDGRQRKWNRQCLLTAWSTYLIGACFGGFRDMSFAQFMELYPPPGYRPRRE